MLNWIKMENENGYIGFDDDCPRYFVRQDEDGWYWEDSWGFGYGGHDTAEEAMEDAEDDMPKVEYTQEGFTWKSWMKFGLVSKHMKEWSGKWAGNPAHHIEGRL